jgi:predicted DsbA family dithiol-disulfide isomerase
MVRSAMTETEQAPITIDVVSDVVCPWCYVGKHRLEKALAIMPERNFAIFWRPFQLDPTIPKGGMPRQAYLERKFGRERLADLHKPLIEIGKAEGIPFAFDKITRSPNTLDAHRLLRWADLDPVIAEINGAQKMGISGVPTFIFGARFALSGAHPAETIKKAIEQLALTAR